MPADPSADDAAASPRGGRTARAVRPARAERWVRLTLSVCGTAAALGLGLLAAGLRVSMALGPLSVTVSDYRKPLVWGAAASAGLLALAWTAPPWRRFAVALLSTLGLLAIAAFARGAAPIVTDADFAVGELYVQLATEGRLLVGPYSRFGWHHPGPLYFYLTAPFYVLGGRQSAVLFAVALAINVTAIATLAWVVARERGQWLTAVLVTAALLFFGWRAPTLLASPWTAHVPVLPSVTFLALAAAVASGRISLLPLLGFVASFVMQTHVGFAPVVVAATMLALAMGAIGRAQSDRPLGAALNRTAWLCAGLWLLPISEVLAGSGGNVASLWRFFVTDATPAHSIREATLNWSYGLTGVLRPDFALPWGAHFALSHLQWGVPCAVGQTLVLALVARRDLRAGRRFGGCLALVALTASLTSLWALTRIRGDILNHDLFRVAVIGAFNLGILAAATLRPLLARAGSRAAEWRRPPIVAIVLTLGLTLGLGARHLDEMTSFERRRHQDAAMVKAHAAIRDYVNAHGIRRPLIRIGEDRWADAAGVLLRLVKDGTPAAVEDRWLSMFTNEFRATGGEDAVVTLADLELHRQLRTEPGTDVLLESHPLFVDAARIR